MIASMTAFARAETGAWIWEVRSVNHRFLDLSFNLPSIAQHLEPDLRVLAKETLNRGRVDASLLRSSKGSETSPTIDVAALRSLLINASHAKTVMQEYDDGKDLMNGSAQPFDVLDVLRWPGVMHEQVSITGKVRDAICTGFADALEILVAGRTAEGASLESMFSSRLATIRDILVRVQAMAEVHVELIREKLSQRIEKLGVNVEPNRVAQEVALLAQRADVNEEVDRLNVHLTEFENCLQSGESHGRRLGFIVQEMARESNTLAAKLAPPDALNLTVDLKVLIDQIREQVQNVE